MSKLLKSGEDYLESILVLHLNKNYVRAVDVAHALNVSKPSVSRAMGLLRENGFIRTAEDGNITLTETGTEIAERIYERHLVLTQWLIDLGVTEETMMPSDVSHLRNRLTQAFAQLPPTLREAYTLFQIGELSIHEIAHETGVSESLVKVRIHRAKQKLQPLLADLRAE